MAALPVVDRDAPRVEHDGVVFATSSPVPLAWQRRLSWVTFPAVVGGFVALSLWGLDRGFPAPAWTAGVVLANIVVILGLERLLPRRPEADALRDRQSLNDMGHAVLVGLVAAPVGQAAAVALVAWAAGALQAAGWYGAWPHGLPFAIQLLLAVLIWGLGDYFVHRSVHEVDRLWWFHVVHHDTPQMNVMKSLRLHWTEEIAHRLIQPLPLLALGAPEMVIFWLQLQNAFLGNLQHSNLAQRFPSWAHYVIPTVQLHAIHHARDRALQDSNYAGVIPIWDLVFGTFRHPDANPVRALGLEDPCVPRGFVRQVLFPLHAVLRPPVVRPPDS